MQLVIYGKEDISTLTNYAKTLFSLVPNKHTQRQSFYSTTSFPTHYNGQIIYYLPVGKEDSLQIFWQVLPLRQKYREHVSIINKYT